jgi:hypothetical protein
MKKLSISCLLLVAFCAVSVQASTILLGTAGSYAVLAGASVVNTGSSVLTGNVGLSPGVSPGCAVGGFPPGKVNGTINKCNGPAAQAQSDLTAAYLATKGLTPTKTLTGTDLGGLVLTPGVYFFADSAQLTGALTLDSLGNPNAQFVFQIGSTLTTASSSDVDVINGGNDGNVFWQVGSSATLGTTTEFAGNILALTSITLNTGASIGCGRALARNGTVTLGTNVISINSGCESGSTTSTPEPGTLSLFALGSSLIALWRAKRRW